MKTIQVMWGSQPRGSSMRKKLLAFAAASAVALAGVLVFAASPASAATPPQLKFWDVLFSDDTCTGKTVVDNIPRSDGIGLVFTVNGDSIAVAAGTTKTVEIAWPESENIVVDLSGIFEEPEVVTLAKSDVQ